MITKINLNNVACYKHLATLETDKKVNLIYGLNGTGKSVLSDFLYNKSNSTFSDCSFECFNNEDILVYNQSFIKDYFHEPDNLKGIFTLSKENKEAEEKVRSAEQEITKLEEEKIKKNNVIEKTHNSELATKKQNADNKTWEIKTNYAGGDRVLEYCLTGLMGKKESLFNHLSSITKPSQIPDKTIGQLKKEVVAIHGSTAQKHNLLSAINFAAQHVESNQILQKTIIGNENSAVAGLIKKLENSDWVKKGLDYLPDKIENAGVRCPFCQEQTITKTLVENIRSYFDKTYENDISELKRLLSDYEIGIDSLQKKETYESNPYVIAKKIEFENLYNAVIQCLRTNKTQIAEKIKTPSQKVSLTGSADKINAFNQFIININEATTEHNTKIDNKDASLAEIKTQFWNIMRWDYDQTISAYQNDKASTELKIDGLKKEIHDIETNISGQKSIVEEQQKKTVNIEKAITNINNGLIELGIDGFKIEKYSDILYKIARTEQCDNTFQTLSEGEKMIISFLYFRELCKGKKTASSYSNKKIIVIDDPISSLSHIYIFNIGQLIKNDFFNSDKHEQIFLLTHSLYFFYEMTDTNHDRRKANQKLFRIIKNRDGSQISEMKYEEIQNDYHSYWLIVKDNKQPPALIANCMRNIIEYFFNFIERRDLNNVFQKPELQKTKYQAFNRYINRESHSFGQNIFDFKEFNYADFKEALGLVFSESGYKEHYDKMMK
jgi:wobble nucleotide-excising tRNase